MLAGKAGGGSKAEKGRKKKIKAEGRRKKGKE